MTNSDSSTTPSLGVVGTLVLFGLAAVLLYAATHFGIPTFAARTGIEPVLLWFAFAGLGVFVPLLAIAAVLLWREGQLFSRGMFRDRLRFRALTMADWGWSLAGLAAIGILGAVSLAVVQLVFSKTSLHPSFMAMDPLTPDRYWILLAWLLFWVANILGEEVLWRGVVLPRQETAFGNKAWLANAAGWLLFHLPFGLTMLLTLWPILFILPYIVQRRQNTWTGVIIHAGLNGPGFLAVAFGLA